MNRDIAALRRDYQHATLLEADADLDPFVQFQRWLDEAVAAGLDEPNAMCLATVGADGFPAARIVLLKGFDQHGFAFFTNFESRKGQELAGCPKAALAFHWGPLDRQVRAVGTVVRLGEEESAAYYRSRPRGSQLGAWASPQSQALPDRAALDRAYAATQERFADAQPPKPPHWGGFRVVPHEFEFWQGRPSRLHDRLQYRLGTEGAWNRVRLAP